MSKKALQLAPLLALFAGCGEAPAEPTWTEDVQPLLVANCIKCHTYPSIGGAPKTFRLDVYETTFTDSGIPILGAGSMAEFIHERTHAETMPPRFPLSGRQIDLLGNWFDTAQDGFPPPKGDPAPGNRQPTLQIEGALDAGLVDGQLLIRYIIEDPDRQPVVGSLTASGPGGDITITGELHSGRGTAIWDVGAAAAGEYELVATLDDGQREVSGRVASYEVIHPSGNHAPTFSFRTLLRDAIINENEGPFEIAFEVDDLDADDSINLVLQAFVGDDVVDVATIDDAPRGENTVMWDVTDVDEGVSWRLRATLTDGNAQRIFESEPFIVSHQTTDLTSEFALNVFSARCTVCHPGVGDLARIPDLAFDLSDYDTVLGVRGTIFRRLVQQRTMPPKSAARLFEGDIEIPDEVLRNMSEWLLAGAPE